MKRKQLSKAQREQIYSKTDGRCAYCGCELSYEDMQIDHVVPLAGGGEDKKYNMLPACRSCNHYKGGATLDVFRKYVEKMPATLERDSVTYRAAVRFGLVVPKPRKIIFYFEKRSAK